MKTAIIYKSFFGTTKKYAKWLNEKMDSDIFTFKQFSEKKFNDYQRFIILSGTYFGWMPLTKYLMKNWRYLKDKNVVVLAVGYVPAKDPWSRKSYEQIPIRIQEKIHYYKVHGKMLFEPKELVKKENLKPVEKLLKKLKCL